MRQHQRHAAKDETSPITRSGCPQVPGYWESYYWLDIGNNSDTGQFVLGQPENGKMKSGGPRLPTAADLFPEIVDPKLDKKDRLPPCSAVEALEQQEPFVNQTLAYQSLAMLARLFRYGRLSYQGGFLNIGTGRLVPLPLNPARLQSRRPRTFAVG